MVASSNLASGTRLSSVRLCFAPYFFSFLSSTSYNRVMNTECNCNKSFATTSEYPCKQPACIKEREPNCLATAVIPSITVDQVDGITELANCLVHVTGNNTTYYVDDKHRVLITWAGPINIPGYDMETNPNGYKNQIVTDTEAQIAVIYDANGKGYVFGILPENLQQAVNNKLDEMAENGELAEMVISYIQLQGMLVFDTVADMKSSTDVVDGSFVETYGYYAKGDGGGAKYKVTSTQPNGYYETLNSGLYAEIIVEPSMAPEQFGAYGDGTHDDTTPVQNAIDNSSVLEFTKTYNVTIANLHSNMELRGKGTIVGTSYGGARGPLNMIGTIANPLTNIKIHGLTVKHGDVTFVEQARLIEVRWANNIKIYDCYFTHWTGDAICISNWQTNSYITRDIYIYDNKFINEHTGRQAITILTGSYIYIRNNYFKDTTISGMPGAIDIEPWYDENVGDLITYEITDIVVDGNYCENGVYNTSFFNTFVARAQTIKNLTITNNTVKGFHLGDGIRMQCGSVGTYSGTKNVYIANNSIEAPFINIMVSGYDAIIENNALTNGLISFGRFYVTAPSPITNIKFNNNSYISNASNKNTQECVVCLNLDTDSIFSMCDNTFEIGHSENTQTYDLCVFNSLVDGASQPTVKPMYCDNKVVYNGEKTYVAFANYIYGTYTDNQLYDTTGNVSTLRLIRGTDAYDTIPMNIEKISYTDKFTPESTSLETVRTFTIPARRMFSMSVYAEANTTNIKYLQILQDGSFVAGSPFGSATKHSVSFNGFSGNSSSTITIKAQFDSVNWNNIITRGFIIKPDFTANI